MFIRAPHIESDHMETNRYLAIETCSKYTGLSSIQETNALDFAKNVRGKNNRSQGYAAK